MTYLTTISPDPILLQLSRESTVYTRFKGICLRRWTQLGQKLQALILSNGVNAAWDVNKKLLLEAFKSKNFEFRRTPLRKILLTLSSEHLKDFIQTAAQISFENDNSLQIQKILSLVTSDELLKSVQVMQKDASWASLDQQVKMVAAAKKVLSQGGVLVLPPRKISAALQVIHRLLDTLLMAFSFFAIGREPGSSWEASYMLDVYAKLFALPFVIATLLNSLLAVPLLAILITVAIVIAMVILATLYVRNRPCSDDIPSCTNKTRQALRNELSPVFAREDETDTLAHHLDASSLSVRVHPIIIAPPGAGKTELINALALRIVQGKVPASQKNKKLFWVNTAELINDPFSYDSTHNKVQRILHHIGKHKDQVILVLDEIQASFHDQSRLWQRLKSLLDAMPYCIAITTTKDYEEHFASPKGDKAFAGRFVKLELKPTSEDQTLFILQQILSREAPELSVPEEILKKIANAPLAVTGRDSPGGPTRLLVQLIALIRQKLTSTPTVDDPAQKALLNARDKLFAKYYKSLGTKEEKGIFDELQEVLKKCIEPAKSAATSIEALRKIGRKIQESEASIGQLALSSSTLSSGPEASRREWLFHTAYNLPMLKEKMPNITTITAPMLAKILP